MGNRRAALLHYRKLLPQAVAHGATLRAIFAQRRIDELSETAPPDRWTALQRDLRLRGLALAAAAGSAGQPWSERLLLALPGTWFERFATEALVELPGLDARTIEADADTVWEVLAGRIRWSFALADGRASAEILAAEGDAVRVDPDLTRRAAVTMIPEMPVECLRFEPALVAGVRRVLAALRSPGGGASGLTPESRALLPSRPLRPEDIDRAPSAPPVPAQ